MCNRPQMEIIKRILEFKILVCIKIVEKMIRIIGLNCKNKCGLHIAVECFLSDHIFSFIIEKDAKLDVQDLI